MKYGKGVKKLLYLVVILGGGYSDRNGIVGFSILSAL